MNTQLLNRLFKILLSVTIPLSSPVFAQQPIPLAGGGGGGIIPPTVPPTNFVGGGFTFGPDGNLIVPSGSATVPGERPNNLLDGHRIRTMSGSYLVYYQGVLDGQGRERIMRPVEMANGELNPQVYRVGVLNPDGTITWEPLRVSRAQILEQIKAAQAVLDTARPNWGPNEKLLFAQRIEIFEQYTAQDWANRINARSHVEVRLISPHSRFVEIAAPKDPLPPSRSLVVVPGQPARFVDRPPGHSGMNTSMAEYFPELDSAYRPSNLARQLGVSGEDLRRYRAQLRRFIRGEKNMFIGDGSRPGTSTLQNIRQGGIELGRGVAGFYIAMGMMSGIMLLTQYPDNPMAWDSYVQSMTSVTGMAQLAGFIAVAGGTYWTMKRTARKFFGPGGPNRFGVRGTIFMSSLIAGALAGTIIVEMMADPNVGKCLGHVAYKVSGTFEPDEAACDAFWDKWSSNEHWNNMAANQLMPMFANMMVAGGLFQAIMIGGNFLFKRQAMAVALRSVRIGWAAKGGLWVTLAGVAVQTTLFLGAYWISDSVFEVGQWVREMMTADWSFSDDPHGSSINDNLTKLLQSWKDLKANGFKDPNVFENVCFDSSRSFNMFYDCDNPDGIGPEGLILKYASFQQQWRRIQMADVENAYTQWRNKSDNYYAMLEVSYDFYKGAIERIIFEKSALTPGENQAGGFNQGYLDIYSQVQADIGTEAWRYTSERSYNGWWKYVDTTKLTDFLVTSMACGPEAEGYGGEPDSWLDGLSDWASGNTSPPLMVDNPTGWQTRFFAPRVVKPIDSNRTTACETGGVRDIFAEMIGEQRVAPSIVPLATPWGRYIGVFDYIKAEIRDSVVDGTTNNFQTWWETNVTPTTVALEREFRADYKKMLDENYFKALTNPDYRGGWCGPTLTTNDGLVAMELHAGFEPYLRRLGSPNDACPADATHRLARGVLNSLRDEMRMYFAMLIDLYVSNYRELGTRPVSSAQEAEDTAVAKAKEMLDVLENVIQSVKEPDPAKRLNIDEAIDRFVALSNQSKLDYLARQIPEGPLPPDERGLNDPPAPLNPHLEAWGFLLGLRIDAVFLETALLYRILTTFEQ